MVFVLWCVNLDIGVLYDNKNPIFALNISRFSVINEVNITDVCNMRKFTFTGVYVSNLILPTFFRFRITFLCTYLLQGCQPFRINSDNPGKEVLSRIFDESYPRCEI